MPKYDVHIYPITRMKVSGIEAASAEEAVCRAEASVGLHDRIASGRAEYAEQIEGFLVDALDDSCHRIEGVSQSFDGNGAPLPSPPRPPSDPDLPTHERTNIMSRLINRVIREVRPMTEAELEAEGWHVPAWEQPIVLVLDDGTKLYAARDAEGNGPGALFGVDPQGRSFRVASGRPPC